MIRASRSARPAALPILAALFLLACLAKPASAAPGSSPSPSAQPSASPSSSPSPQGSPSAKPKPPKPDEWTEASRIFEQLSPDQKAKFLDNLEQWKNMSPEERELFRDRELFRREKIAQEIQDSLNKTGLKLDSDQRDVFALRYTQERRKIEEALHKEMDHERQIRVNAMLDRLKIEFTPTPTPSPEPPAAASP